MQHLGSPVSEALNASPDIFTAAGGLFSSTPEPMTDQPARPSPAAEAAAEPDPKPSAASAGRDAQLQYDEAVLGSLAVVHTAGLTLALAGQQLLAWDDRSRAQEHPACFQVSMLHDGQFLAFLIALRDASLTLRRTACMACHHGTPQSWEGLCAGLPPTRCAQLAHQRVSTGMQALQEAVQQMQSKRLLPASVGHAMRQLLQQQHGKVQVGPHVHHTS